MPTAHLYAFTAHSQVYTDTEPSGQEHGLEPIGYMKVAEEIKDTHQFWWTFSLPFFQKSPKCTESSSDNRYFDNTTQIILITVNEALRTLDHIELV